MKKIVILLVVLMMVFAFTIPASARGIGPGDGTGPIGGLGPIRGNDSGRNSPGSGIGPGDGTGPIGGLGPIRGNDSGRNGYVIGQGLQGSATIFVMVGKISALGTNMVTIEVISGNKLVQPSLGTQVTVTVTSQTRYLYKDGTTTTTIGFTDLKEGQQVSANGTVANNVWTASRITVGASLSCLP